MDEFVFGSLSTIEKRVAHLQAWYQGIKHHNQLEPRAPQAGDQPVVTVTVMQSRQIERILCVVTEPATAVYTLHRAQNRWDLLNWAYVESWQATLPAQPAGTLVRYHFEAYEVGSDTPLPTEDDTIFSYLVGAVSASDWTASVVMYQIFPDRFYPGNGRSWTPAPTLDDFYGGTLRGIIEKLDYVADMGFNAIWLNPFFLDDDTHHGYHAIDYFQVKPRLGSMDDIRELVQQAHARGIRLILDFVANHWSSQHPSFQEAIQDPNSKYTEWYNWIDYPHDYETFFGVMHLPQVNANHPEVRQYLIDSVRFWLAEIGFDGLRCDYALGPSHDFWTELRHQVQQFKPDAWIFGEVVESPATILSYEGRFHGCLDFPLMQAMRDTFALNRMSLSQFDNFLHQQDAYFPATFNRPTFLDNHDMNRYYWLVGEDKRKLKLSALCQFTLAGQPVVYNGSEVGVHQEMGMWEAGSQGMAESRQPMRWGDEQDAEIRDFYQELIALRKANPVLWHGRRTTLHVDEANRTWMYARHDDQTSIVVALNLSDEPRTVTAVFQHTTYTFHLSPWSGDWFVDN
jgi:glycosidase